MDKGGPGLLYFEMIDPVKPTMSWHDSLMTAKLAVEEAAAQYSSIISDCVWLWLDRVVRRTKESGLFLGGV